MNKVEEFKLKSINLIEQIKELGEGFDVCIDEDGGYIEINGIEIRFDENLNISDTVVYL